MNSGYKIVLILIIISINLYGQSAGVEEDSVHYVVRNDSVHTRIHENFVQSILNDTIIIEEYEIIYPSGCGSSWRKNGAYIKRNNNGSLSSIGEYQWNRKIGQWIYFYRSGAIRKIESYTVPFDNNYWLELNTKLLHWIGPFFDGIFVEYHPNGCVKQIGKYELIYQRRYGLSS